MQVTISKVSRLLTGPEVSGSRPIVATFEVHRDREEVRLCHLFSPFLLPFLSPFLLPFCHLLSPCATFVASFFVTLFATFAALLVVTFLPSFCHLCHSLSQEGNIKPLLLPLFAGAEEGWSAEEQHSEHH